MRHNERKSTKHAGPNREKEDKEIAQDKREDSVNKNKQNWRGTLFVIVCVCFCWISLKMRIFVTDSLWWNSRSTTVPSGLVLLAKLTVEVTGHHGLPLHVRDPCPPPPCSPTHSSIYLFGDREQLERLASCQPRALDSAPNQTCPAHHRRTTAHQDTEMTRNTSPDSSRGRSHRFFFDSPATSLCLPAF